MNSEMNLFNPVDLELSRSSFEMTPTHSGTCNAGRLCVGGVWEILPGDSIRLDLKSLFKMSTPVYPTMDVLYADVFFFFVPNRLLLGNRYGSPSVSDSNHTWSAIIGAQDNLVGAPIPASGLEVPGVFVAETLRPGTLDDYILNSDSDFTSYPNFLNCLPWLAYFSIWNEDFRDESTTNPVTWSYDASLNRVDPYGNVPIYATKQEIADAKLATISDPYKLVNALAADDNPTSAASPKSARWLPFPTFRFHGYFGSLLPWPQRNSAGVELPLGDSAPILTASSYAAMGAHPIKLYDHDGHTINEKNLATGLTGNVTAIGSASVEGVEDFAYGINLIADLKHATAANVNALRAAIQKQRWYEKLARSGNRYDELEYGLFGVRPHDSGLDRPLYLGGKRIPLNIEMVASTNGSTTASSGEGAGSLGALGAFSHTNDRDHMFYHSFDEWGILMCVFTIRHHDTFSSGVEELFYRKTREDYYFPTFAHLGEAAIPKKFLGRRATDDSVFGYQQAWESYRQFPDKVSGLLKVGKSLDFMTYASSFSNPTLAEFLNASYQVETVDRTLAVGSNAAGFQFVYQLTFDMKMRRCLPTYSIPGLMDHY